MSVIMIVINILNFIPELLVMPGIQLTVVFQTYLVFKIRFSDAVCG